MEMTQEELARKSRVPRGTIQNIEYDKVSPRIENLRALADVLEVSLDYLSPGKSTPLHYDPSPEELAVIFYYVRHAEPVTRLSALLLLTGRDTYRDQLRAIPGGAPFASVLEKLRPR